MFRGACSRSLGHRRIGGGCRGISCRFFRSKVLGRSSRFVGMRDTLANHAHPSYEASQCFRSMGRKTKALTLLAATSFLLAGCPIDAPALGTETFGNRPLNDRSCEQEWPNIASIIDDTNRVYQYWVNGGEGLFFKGNTEALNKALQRFALVQTDVHEVVLLPGPATVSSLMRDKEFDYDLLT